MYVNRTEIKTISFSLNERIDNLSVTYKHRFTVDVSKDVFQWVFYIQ